MALSAPRVLDGGRTLLLDTAAVARRLMCSLCGGLLRTPFTFKECQHTFCKACLAEQFTEESDIRAGCKHCPAPGCSTLWGGSSWSTACV